MTVYTADTNTGCCICKLSLVVG